MFLHGKKKKTQYISEKIHSGQSKIKEHACYPQIDYIRRNQQMEKKGIIQRLTIENMQEEYRKLNALDGEFYLKNIKFADLDNHRVITYKVHKDSKDSKDSKEVFEEENTQEFQENEELEYRKKLREGVIPVYMAMDESITCSSEDKPRTFRHELGHAKQGKIRLMDELKLTTIKEMENICRHENINEEEKRVFYKHLLVNQLESSDNKEMAAKLGHLLNSLIHQQAADSTAEILHYLDRLKITKAQIETLTGDRMLTPEDGLSKFLIEDRDGDGDEAGKEYMKGSFLTEVAVELFSYKQNAEQYYSHLEQTIGLLKKVYPVIFANYSALENKNSQVGKNFKSRITRMNELINELYQKSIEECDVYLTCLKFPLKQAYSEVVDEDDALLCEIVYDPEGWTPKNVDTLYQSYVKNKAGDPKKQEIDDYMEIYKKALEKQALINGLMGLMAEV